MLHGRRFTAITDHSALVWLRTMQDPSGRNARWMMALQRYVFDIVHRPGITLTHADGLSRGRVRPGEEDIVDKMSDVMVDPSACPLCKLRKVARRICAMTTRSRTRSQEEAPPEPVPQAPPALRLATAEVDSLPAIRDWTAIAALQEEDQSLMKWYGGTATDRPMYKGRFIFVKDWAGVLWLEDPQDGCRQLVVPAAQREALVRFVHASRYCTAHGGVNKTVRSLKVQYWWPKMESEIRRIVRQCSECATRKAHNRAQNTKLNVVVKDPDRPFEILAMDLIGPLPKTENGHKYILTMVDAYSRWAFAVPLKTASAEEVATVMLRDILKDTGMPAQIVSDRGKHFVNKCVRQVMDKLGITGVRLAPYNPSANGLVERYNKTIKENLAMYQDSKDMDWDEVIPGVLMAYRQSYHASIGCSPFEMLMHVPPRTPADAVMRPAEAMEGIIKAPGAAEKESSRKIRRATQFICDRAVKTKQEWRRLKNLKRPTAREFKVGESVAMDTHHHQHRNKAMRHRFELGEVTQVLGPDRYEVTLKKNGKVKTANVAQLKSVRPDLGFIQPGQEALRLVQNVRPTVSWRDISADPALFGVEEIVDHEVRTYRSGHEEPFVRVRWTGVYPDSWIKLEDLQSQVHLEAYAEAHGR